MTPAITLLEKQKVDFQVLSYEHDANVSHYGSEAVEKLNVSAEQVFKTLVLKTNDNALIVAVTPVNQQADLKLLAKALGCKKVTMAEQQQVQNSTGYLLGGVSPLGQKKRLPTYIHQSACQFQQIYVSAGKRGLELALQPQDLANLCQAKFADF